jgi:sodium/hydrogen exchanger 8
MGPLRSFLVKMGLASTSDYSSVVAITLFITLLYACIVIGHLLEKNRWMSESIATLIIGLYIRLIVLLFSQVKISHTMLFNEDLVFHLSPSTYNI